MSGRRLRRAAAAAALGLGAVLGALAVLYGDDVPVWSIPLLAAAVLVLFELVSLSRRPAPDAAVERPAVAVLVGRLLVAALLAVAGATVALLAAAVPARHGLATGLLGAAAAAALFLLVAALARRRA